jgi:hypothetical protein
MGVSDARRLEVYEQARAQWGEGPAEALMEMVVPAGQDMATRQDVERASFAFRAEMDLRFAKVDARFERLDERLATLASREFVLWTFVAGMIPLYGMLIGVLIAVYGG